MCQHFVSDLIWTVLKTNLVPVVFGKKINDHTENSNYLVLINYQHKQNA